MRLTTIFGEKAKGASTPQEAAELSDVMWVRSSFAIAQINDLNKDIATGYRFSSADALKVYGLWHLEDAVEYGSSVIYKRKGLIEDTILSRRKELGLSQKAVAVAADVPVASVIEAEDDLSEMTLFIHLVSIARVLGLCPLKLGFREE